MARWSGRTGSGSTLRISGRCLSRDIDDIEMTVNNEIRKNEQVQTEVMSIQDAVSKGALAFFGDKIWRAGAGGDRRILQQRALRRNALSAYGDIGLFRIVSETGVAAGVRRIEHSRCPPYAGQCVPPQSSC